MFKISTVHSHFVYVFRNSCRNKRMIKFYQFSTIVFNQIQCNIFLMAHDFITLDYESKHDYLCLTETSRIYFKQHEIIMRGKVRIIYFYKFLFFNYTHLWK